ncbi:MAG: MCE family protein [Actinomycetota bacterium]|nr:MCE family protein [Actinomycetota bacterium]
MKRNIVPIQLAIFGLVSLLILVYTVFGLLHYAPFSTPISMTVQLNDAGGLFNGSEVAYRGVAVGTVDSVDLQRDGVTAKLTINEGTQIPANSIAHVDDLSVAGEQYIDLVPTSTTGPIFKNGDIIPASRTTTPISTPELLLSVEKLVKTINPADIGTITHELSTAFDNAGPQLRSLLDSGTTLVNELSASQKSTLDLLRNGQILLNTAANHAGDFATVADSLAKLSDTLKTSTPTIEKLIAQAPGMIKLFNDIIRDNGSTASILLGSLADFTGIAVANVPGLKALLVAVPEFGRLLPTVVRGGVVNAGVLINYNEPTCAYGVPLTSPLGTVPSSLYRVSCPISNAAILPRGAANAPPPGGGASTR